MGDAPQFLRLGLAFSAGFVAGAALVGGIVWAHMAIKRNHWLEMWKAEARLRARDRYERAGEADYHPFQAPPIKPNTSHARPRHMV